MTSSGISLVLLYLIEGPSILSPFPRQASKKSHPAGQMGITYIVPKPENHITI